MKYLFFCLFLSSTVLAQSDNQYNLIPFPARFSGQNGQFSISASTRVITSPATDATVRAVAQTFVNQLKAANDLSLAVAPTSPALAKGAHIFFALNKKLNLGDEGYKLTVTPGKVLAEAATSKGLFYAAQTIRQLLPAGKSATVSLPACAITDKPRFGYRGLMLDVGRHFMPVPFVKKFIDLMALHKQNTFHWHLTDDQGWRIDIKKYPKLTQIGSKRAESIVGQYYQNYPQQFDGKPVGGFYTQEEIKDVVRYAQTRFVTIVPEIEMPGHAQAALAAYPELGCDPAKGYQVYTKWGVSEDVYCPSEKTFGFLQDVLTEVIALFPGKYIHIGGDECPKTAWKNSAFCQELMKKNNLKDENELQSYFIRRIEKFLNSKGRSIIGWDEILEGGLAPNAAVMSWRGTEGGIAAAKQKHAVIMTPGATCYLDQYQGNPATEPLAIGGYLPLDQVYAYEPMPNELAAADQKYILGVQGNIWTEYMPTPESVEYMAFPRAIALAELGWMQPGPHNFEDFAQRLKNHLPKLTGVNYAKRLFDITASTQPNEQGQIQVVLKKLDTDSQIFYTLNGKEPNERSTEYIGPITLTKTTTIRAMTRTGGAPTGGQLTQTFTLHKGKNKPYTYALAPDQSSDPTSAKLTDGVRGDTPRSRREWVSFYGSDMDLTLDLGDITSVTKVSLNFLKIILEKGFPPTAVEIALSKDESDFKDAITQPVTYDLNGPWAILPVVADFKTARARYVRIRAKNAGVCPAGHPNAGAKTWLATDEVVVE
ncbi:glycoside hydrolase family 20 protein [Spirosoma radiotolerans]|uniref:beta-N-acetylhexosaminidase n=1 Tax=Spirosoma radiotolerans TaxID=1379870 RepID=A0A0E3ZUZ9_9BACT|nr:family 20 glycosylhydrolase [Spirosoma radiotolerans]AKD55519.1 beta-N-acetylhexosaminidase [Spirosoma radiotolerans]